MIIYKKYYFDTAHFMPNHSKNHKYSKVHGHSYEITIFLNGKQNKKNAGSLEKASANFHLIKVYPNILTQKVILKQTYAKGATEGHSTLRTISTPEETRIQSFELLRASASQRGMFSKVARRATSYTSSAPSAPR